MISTVLAFVPVHLYFKRIDGAIKLHIHKLIEVLMNISIHLV